MALIVQKFGGSSVADAERVRRVAGIIADTYCEGNSVIVVLSAQGDTTDDLIAKAKEINPDTPSRREMDMLLSSGEQISIALLAMAIEKSMEQVKTAIENHDFPFNDATIEEYYERFLLMNRPLPKR